MRLLHRQIPLRRGFGLVKGEGLGVIVLPIAYCGGQGCFDPLCSRVFWSSDPAQKSFSFMLCRLNTEAMRGN